jgi:hypothetical protein
MSFPPAGPDGQPYSRTARAILFLYPLSILFCPPVDLWALHARPDEIVTILGIPLAFRDLTRPGSYAYRATGFRLAAPYTCLFLMLCWGIVWGDSVGSLTGSYVRTIVSPLFFAMEIFVFASLLTRARLDNGSTLLGLTTAVAGAGLLGLYAMTDPATALVLVRTFMPDLEFHKYAASTFNMSTRAMSVFYGYDHAAVTYALSALAAVGLLLTHRRRVWYTAILTALLISLVASMVSSARVGVLAFLGAGLAQLMLGERVVFHRRLLAFASLAGVIGFIVSIPIYFPENATLMRLVDLVEMLDVDGSASLLERSEALDGMVGTQIYDKPFPTGIDVLVGSGDDTQFISDVGYVTVYIKYGVFGLCVVLYTFLTWLFVGLSSIARRKRLGAAASNTVTTFVLPGMAVLFAIAAMKGPLYFLSFKTGDLVALLCALVLVECSTLIPISQPAA